MPSHWFKLLPTDPEEIKNLSEEDCNAALTVKFGRRYAPQGAITNWTQTTEAVDWLETQINFPTYQRYQRQLNAATLHHFPGTPRKAVILAYVTGLLDPVPA